MVLTIRDSLEDPAQVFLPKRYSDVVTDDDIETINTNAVTESRLQRCLCKDESLPVSDRDVMHIFFLLQVHPVPLLSATAQPSSEYNST